MGYSFAGGAPSIATADKDTQVLLVEKAPLDAECGNSRYAAQHVIVVKPEKTNAEAIEYYKALRGNNTNPSDETIASFVKGARENINCMKFLGAKEPKQ